MSLDEAIERLRTIIISPESTTDRVLHEILEVIVYGGIGYVLRGVIDENES